MPRGQSLVEFALLLPLLMVILLGVADFGTGLAGRDRDGVGIWSGRGSRRGRVPAGGDTARSPTYAT